MKIEDIIPDGWVFKERRELKDSEWDSTPENGVFYLAANGKVYHYLDADNDKPHGGQIIVERAECQYEPQVGDVACLDDDSGKRIFVIVDSLGEGKSSIFWPKDQKPFGLRKATLENIRLYSSDTNHYDLFRILYERNQNEKVNLLGTGL